MTVATEIQLVDFSDEDLRLRVGSLHEAIKRLEEAKRNDSTVVRLKEELKAYTDEHYGNELKTLSLDLKASRAHAKLRGLTFNLDS